MRELTDDEMSLLRQRQEGFDSFFEESVPVLVDFMERLGLPEPYMVMRDADKYLAPLDNWLKCQAIGPDEETWIVTRVGYFLGELLTQRYGGIWFIDREADSPHFAHYVVGQFSRRGTRNVNVDPFVCATNYLHQPPGRSLSTMVDTIAQEITASMPK